MEKQIPQIIIDKAHSQGCNSISFCGTRKDGTEVYGIGYVDENGITEPTGLPELLLLKDGVVEIVCGFKSFDIIDELEK